MLCDTDPIIRSKAVDLILRVRSGSEYGDMSVRTYEKPKVNIDCSTYHDLIDWETEEVLEPVFTFKLTTEALLDLKEKPLDIPKMPHHAQAMERQVKVTTRAAKNVAGFQSRDGYIRAIQESRKRMSSFDTKKDFIYNFI